MYLNYFKHLKALCERHNITPVGIEEVWGSVALQGEDEVNGFIREVRISACMTATDYTVALHEIGHIVDPDGHQPDNKWGSEIAASRWAIANAEHPIELDALLYGLQSYDHTKSREELLAALGVSDVA